MLGWSSRWVWDISIDVLTQRVRQSQGVAQGFGFSCHALPGAAWCLLKDSRGISLLQEGALDLLKSLTSYTMTIQLLQVRGFGWGKTPWGSLSCACLVHTPRMCAWCVSPDHTDWSGCELSAETLLR